MISIEISKLNSSIVHFRMNGHAETADYGKDIVCAGVSVLAFSTINSLQEVCKLKEKMAVDFSEGQMEMKLDFKNCTHEQMRDSQIILKGFELNMKNLMMQYPNAIMITDKEVK